MVSFLLKFISNNFSGASFKFNFASCFTLRFSAFTFGFNLFNAFLRILFCIFPSSNSGSADAIKFAILSTAPAPAAKPLLLLSNMLGSIVICSTSSGSNASTFSFWSIISYSPFSSCTTIASGRFPSPTGDTTFLFLLSLPIITASFLTFFAGCCFGSIGCGAFLSPTVGLPWSAFLGVLDVVGLLILFAFAFAPVCC